MRTLRRFCTPVSPDYHGRVPVNQRFAAVTFDDAHRSVLENALPVLRRDKIPCVIFFITEWFGLSAPWAGREGYEAQDTYLTEDDLAQLPTDLVLVGSHTATHPRLPGISGSQRLAELADSRRCLQRFADRPVSLFAFPFGALSSDCLREAAHVGYERVFTVEPKAAFKRPNEFVTGRVAADPWDWKIEFLLKLHGAYNWRSPLFALRDRIRAACGAAERLTVAEEESIHIESGGQMANREYANES
jgi:peptidoglycan/xylan/chitin deacetylase (PgdA/CDA1 family)